MSTDRELLALAAKAAGMKDLVWGDEQALCIATVQASQRIGWRRCWNPEENDGDAFRLILAIGGNLHPAYVGLERTKYWCVTDRKRDISVMVLVNGDERVAARLAIFQAAIEIAKAMP